MATLSHTALRPSSSCHTSSPSPASCRAVRQSLVLVRGSPQGRADKPVSSRGCRNGCRTVLRSSLPFPSPSHPLPSRQQSGAKWRIRAMGEDQSSSPTSESSSSSSSSSSTTAVVEATEESKQASAEPAAAASSSTSSTPSSSSSSADPVPAVATDKAEKKTTKDVLALKSLDAYFEKLNGPSKAKEESSASAATAAANAATSTTIPAQEGSSAGTGEGSSSTVAKQQQAQGDAQSSADSKQPMKDEEISEMLRKILEQAMTDADSGKQQTDQQQKGGKSPVEFSTSVDIDTFGPTVYERWLARQMDSSTPTALNTLLAINIAVFLFELASPQAVPGLLVTSLPSLLGAKVNTLIAQGEWWRLVTPMFLHEGFLHLAFGTFVLLTIGAGMEVALGSLGFLGAYLSGGIVGNVFSYLNTPDVTIGGTGPIYAVIGAYVVFLYRNRDAIGAEDANGRITRLVFFAALNIALGNPLPIDDWTHIGALVGGVLFGSIATPTLTRIESKPKDKQQQLPTPQLSQINSDDDALNALGKVFQVLSSTVANGGDTLEVKHADPSQQALAFAACVGLGLLLLQVSTAAIPSSLLDITDDMSIL